MQIQKGEKGMPPMRRDRRRIFTNHEPGCGVHIRCAVLHKCSTLAAMLFSPFFLFPFLKKEKVSYSGRQIKSWFSSEAGRRKKAAVNRVIEKGFTELSQSLDLQDNQEGGHDQNWGVVETGVPPPPPSREHGFMIYSIPLNF